MDFDLIKFNCKNLPNQSRFLDSFYKLDLKNTRTSPSNWRRMKPQSPGNSVSITAKKAEDLILSGCQSLGMKENLRTIDTRLPKRFNESFNFSSPVPLAKTEQPTFLNTPVRTGRLEPSSNAAGSKSTVRSRNDFFTPNLRVKVNAVASSKNSKKLNKVTTFIKTSHAGPTEPGTAAVRMPSKNERLDTY